jgi:hypothetical protein
MPPPGHTTPQPTPQRTIGGKHLLLLAIGLLLIAGGAYVVFGGGDDTPTATTPGSPTGQASTAPTAPVGVVPGAPAATQPTTAAPGGGQPTGGAFAAARTAFSQVRTYKATITTSGAAPVQMTVDFQVPDRYRATIAASAGSPPVEVIGIGNQTYLRIGTAWQAAPASGLPFSPAGLIGQAEFFLTSANVTQGGTANAGGATCQVYMVTTATNQRAEMCISNDNLPRQLRYTDAAGTFTIVFSDYNANLNIVPPI